VTPMTARQKRKIHAYPHTFRSMIQQVSAGFICGQQPKALTTLAAYCSYATTCQKQS
jgi:hypothetical protein